MKFSVIIPVYNKADTVAESIESVLSQTEKDYELIIVNDGSTDNINDVLAAYEQITVINQENRGVAKARNSGIDVAQGDFVCFLDADDLWYPNHLQELSALIERFPEAGMYFTSHKETMPDGRVVHSNRNLHDFATLFLCENLFKLLNSNSYGIIHTNSVCIRKRLIFEKNIYFEVGEKIGEDTDMWYRIALYCSVAFSKTETTIYRRENSTATKYGSNSFSWVFARRWSDIKNQEYNPEKLIECQKMIERYNLACSRDCILMHNRKEAIKWLKTVSNRDKRYYLTLLLICFPFFLSKKIITSK